MVDPPAQILADRPSGAAGRAVRLLNRAASALNVALMLAGGAALLAVMLIVVFNVVARELRLDFVGAYELVGYLGAVAIAFALGRTQQRKSHVAVDVLTRRFPRRVNRWIDRIRYLAKLAFAVVVAWRVLRIASALRDSGEVSETLKIAYWPFVICVAAGFAVLALTVLADLANTFAAASKTEGTRR
jgi:TRAP-type C4-dicarboxylate transport system permease small subunit